MGLVIGFEILLQSALSTEYLETRIEGFLDYFKDLLVTLEEDVFDRMRFNLIEAKSAAPSNICAAGRTLWSPISHGSYDFANGLQDIEALTTTTKNDILELFLTKIHSPTPHRKKISIHLIAQDQILENLNTDSKADHSRPIYSAEWSSMNGSSDTDDLFSLSSFNALEGIHPLSKMLKKDFRRKP
ncbi:hypothetical protein QFC21_007358 [Naganishia friedmannii]|uniref:Uncharacterized protein n=1 Tax=Naganishia friedmannii TaxID=89922 RepID=A0ACC2UV22_9TREE|nr:hypothetical protein QFC21_007358 [Naganishia friedmannii]